MSRLPPLLSALALGSQSLRRCGGVLADAGQRLDRLEAAPEPLAPPAGWSALLAGAEVAGDRLAFAPERAGTTDGPGSVAPVPGLVRERGHDADPGAAKAQPPLEAQALAASLFPSVSQAGSGGAHRPVSVGVSGNRSGASVVPDAPTPSRHPGAQWAGPSGSMARSGARTVLGPMSQAGPAVAAARPSGAADASSGPARDGVGARALDETLRRALERIDGAGMPGSQSASAGPGRAARASQGQGRDAPGTTVGASGRAAPVRPASVMPAAPSAAQSIPPGSRPGGLARLLRRAQDRGLDPGAVSASSEHLSPGAERNAVGGLTGPGSANAGQAGVSPCAGLSPRVADLPVSGPFPAGPVDGAGRFETTRPAAPSHADTLARDLSDLLRREARAAGIDLDGGVS